MQIDCLVYCEPAGGSCKWQWTIMCPTERELNRCQGGRLRPASPRAAGTEHELLLCNSYQVTRTWCNTGQVQGRLWYHVIIIIFFFFFSPCHTSWEEPFRLVFIAYMPTPSSVVWSFLVRRDWRLWLLLAEQFATYPVFQNSILPLTSRSEKNRIYKLNKYLLSSITNISLSAGIVVVFILFCGHMVDF